MGDGMPEQWPERIWIVRHGESTGNVARDRADASGLLDIDIAERDLDVPLSSAGETQSRALGRWFARMPIGCRPTAMLVSPYLRARDSGALIQQEGGLETNAVVQIDERLREKEFGALDRLTKRGIEERFPDQAKIRERIGKFYFRPPGGESWCDVILRLRSLLATMNLEHGNADRRVLIVSHQVVVLGLRYVIEGLTESEILAIDRAGDIANCGVTEYERDDSSGAQPRPRLVAYNFVAPLEREGAPVTSEPAAPRHET
jgi:probable phosphoglycerate mutase